DQRRDAGRRDAGRGCTTRGCGHRPAARPGRPDPDQRRGAAGLQLLMRRAGQDPTVMPRLLPLAAASAAALLASGCATAPRGALTAQNNTGLYSLHQPVVERTDYVFDVAATANGLSAAEQDRLDAWFASIQLRYGDRLSVDAPG